MIEGYKFFTEGFRSRHNNIQYKVGETYIYDGEIRLSDGFYFSRELEDAFLHYYSNAKYCCIVEGRGNIIERKNKVVCSEIYIKEELDFNSVLSKLSKNDNWNIREAVVLNENCPQDILDRLSKDDNEYIRYYVARNKNCSQDILRKLSEDKWSVKLCVALNDNCPEDILDKLSNDESYFIRANVALNNNCPQDILRKLSDDEYCFVRENVVKNKNCPQDILKKLSKDY